MEKKMERKIEKKYTTLRSEEIVKTVALLENRIKERFPNSGLREVAHEVRVTASEARKKAININSPHKLYKGLSIFLIISVICLFVYMLTQLRFVSKLPNVLEFLEFLEAGLSSIIFIGAGIVFLVSLERRFKRHLIMKALHELRSLAHVVDMHQLTKDPEIASFPSQKTHSSPSRELSPFELSRYLDYCSELLALIAKIASLYVDEFHDQIALDAVDQLQTLTNGMSRKIWQKIMILNDNMKSHIQQEELSSSQEESNNSKE